VLILSFRDSEQNNRSARGAPRVTDGVLISFLIGLNKLHSEEFMEISIGLFTLAIGPVPNTHSSFDNLICTFFPAA